MQPLQESPVIPCGLTPFLSQISYYANRGLWQPSNTVILSSPPQLNIPSTVIQKRISTYEDMRDIIHNNHGLLKATAGNGNYAYGLYSHNSKYPEYKVQIVLPENGGYFYDGTLRIRPACFDDRTPVVWIVDYKFCNTNDYNFGIC